MGYLEAVSQNSSSKKTLHSWNYNLMLIALLNKDSLVGASLWRRTNVNFKAVLNVRILPDI